MMWRRRASVRLGAGQDLARAVVEIHCASPLPGDRRPLTDALKLDPFLSLHPRLCPVFASGQTAIHGRTPDHVSLRSSFFIHVTKDTAMQQL
ncbi:uncharacterized protein BJX67DRAFT_227016 [Aspergillus lucknowensis]|uniref:Uncharacterized protein n=1 Tax=Aspergillus lucknowensis TaxID=176173 RepID=A0ABR4LLD2_9EURO